MFEAIENKPILDLLRYEPIGLERRLLGILYRQKNWLTTTKIFQLIIEEFKSFIVDKHYDRDYVYKKLRKLEAYGLIAKRLDTKTWGKTSMYIINAYGQAVFERTLNRKNKQIIKIEQNSSTTTSEIQNTDST